jgi:hypothetical protein
MTRTRIPAKPSKVTRGQKLSTQTQIDIKIKALDPLQQASNALDAQRIGKTLGCTEHELVKRIHYAQDPYNVNPMLPLKVWKASVELARNKVHGAKQAKAL